MTDKQIISGIKYEKLTQDQLHDLSQWELVDIILAYRKDLKAIKKECEKLKDLANNALEKVNNYLDKKEKSLLYKQTLIEIKDIARVNSINTCWTAINLCADCDEIEECGLQSPFEKLKAIIQIISECGVMDE